MRFLVIGLGSMGKRRIRNLSALQQTEIAGFDLRQDRRDEVADKYGINTYGSFEVAFSEFAPDIFIISTPPDLHMEYAYRALELNKHAFIEASVTDADKIEELAKLSEEKKLFILPSCTMKFFPGPIKIKQLIDENAIGKILNINYHVGQYLPDWHPWEKVQDFYVSKRETGATREIVPFELTWINGLFGCAEPKACLKDRKGDFEADIDDIYHSLLKYPNGEILNLTIDVLSRPVAVRSMRILGSRGIIEFERNPYMVRYINDKNKDWTTTSFEEGTVESNYIYSEEPYIKEIDCLITSITKQDRSMYPNSLLEDASILRTLYVLEGLS